MRGLIFTEFIQLVEEKFGVVMADEVLSTPGLTDGGAYTSVGQYPHAEMLAMVGALSERSGIPASDLCKVFGEWVFPRLVRAFDFSVRSHSDAFAFLSALDGLIHVEVQKLYPEAELPSVPVVRMDDRELVMEYRSKRPLADVAEGLLRGTLAWFGERAELRRETLEADEARSARFRIIRKAAAQ
jgi:hypothetical protein